MRFAKETSGSRIRYSLFEASPFQCVCAVADSGVSPVPS